MADSRKLLPQIDRVTVPSSNLGRPQGLWGGADLWDNGLAGRLLSADWFWQPDTAHTLLIADPVF